MAEADSAVRTRVHLASDRKPRERGPLQRFVRNRSSLGGAVLVALVLLAVILAPIISPYDPNRADLAAALRIPDQKHWFGTDNLGRDVFSRVIFGGRVTIPIAAVGVLEAVLVGVPLGLIAGYYGHFLDTTIMRLTDILLAFPSMLLAIAITSTLGVALSTVSIAIAVFSTPTYIRLVRAEALRLREREFVVAARCVGAKDHRIIWRHILPNSLSLIIIQSSLNMAFGVLTVSALSFLGLGAQPPTAEWGAMLADARADMRAAPHVAIFPGLAILIFVLGLNLLGDGLRDAYDPQSKR